MTDNPTLSPQRQPEDQDAALRPKSLGEFIGQEAARENLRVVIEAARGRGEAMDHVLFFGPPGLGKTTLAQIVAREMGVGFRGTSGPVIARAGDLAALLTNLEPHDVLARRIGLVAVTVAFIATLNWLGVTLGLLIAMLAALWVSGVRSRAALVWIPLAVAASVYLLFIAVLQSELPHGPVEWMLAKLLS